MDADMVVFESAVLSVLCSRLEQSRGACMRGWEVVGECPVETGRSQKSQLARNGLIAGFLVARCTLYRRFFIFIF